MTMLMRLDVQWEKVSIHDLGRMQEVWGQSNTDVSILRVMIAQGRGEKSELGVAGAGALCVCVCVCVRADYESHFFFV